MIASTLEMSGSLLSSSVKLLRLIFLGWDNVNRYLQQLIKSGILVKHFELRSVHSVSNKQQ
jgi:hypothetical protein